MPRRRVEKPQSLTPTEVKRAFLWNWLNSRYLARLDKGTPKEKSMQIMEKEEARGARMLGIKPRFVDARDKKKKV